MEEKQDKIVIAKSQLPEKDVFSDFSINTFFSTLQEKERVKFFSVFCGAGSVINTAVSLDNSKNYFVEIPKHLRKALKEGRAHFDKSKVIKGNFTANIRMKGEKGIIGQATITEGIDMAAVSNSLSNLAMYGMMQQISSQLDIIEKKLDDIYRGQSNDRIGGLLGAFNNFAVTCKNKKNETTKQIALQASNSIAIELGKIHTHVDSLFRDLNKAPQNDWEVVKDMIFHPASFRTEYFRKKYRELVKEMYNYVKGLEMQTFILLYLEASDEIIKDNNLKFERLLSRFAGESFYKRMRYINYCEVNEIPKLQAVNNDMVKFIELKRNGAIEIECVSNEIIR